MAVQEVEFELTPAEMRAVNAAAMQCGLTASEYARLTILGAVIDTRAAQRTLANATRTRL